jgi:hypothetical protein
MRLFGLTAAIGVAVLMTACGGGGGGNQTLSADEFRQQADAICAEYEGKINDLGSPSSLDELPDFVDKVIPIIEEGNAKLADLDPPEELASDWDQAMELQDQNLDVAHDLQDAIHDKDTAKVQELLTKLNETDAQSNAIARKIGLEDCGQQNTQ